VSAVERIDADVFQRLAFWADLAVLLGHVGELVDALEIRRPIGIFFHQDVSRDAALIDPKVLVCLDCGFARFTTAETEVAELAKGVGRQMKPGSQRRDPGAEKECLGIA